MRKRVDREIAILHEVFSQRCVDQVELKRRWFNDNASSARAGLCRMAEAGDLTRASRKQRHTGKTTWSVTEQGLGRLQALGLAPKKFRYSTVVPEDRVDHQCSMNAVGILLDIWLTHEHLLVVPDVIREKSRTLPDAMFETTGGKRIYFEMDQGNYRAERFQEKINGIRPALGPRCELWMVVPNDQRRSEMLAEVGPNECVYWYTSAEIIGRELPAEIDTPVHYYPSPDESLALAQAALGERQRSTAA